MSTTTPRQLGTCATTDFVRCRTPHTRSQFCTDWVALPAPPVCDHCGRRVRAGLIVGSGDGRTWVHVTGLYRCGRGYGYLFATVDGSQSVPMMLAAR